VGRKKVSPSSSSSLPLKSAPPQVTRQVFLFFKKSAFHCFLFFGENNVEFGSNAQGRQAPKYLHTADMLLNLWNPPGHQS